MEITLKVLFPRHIFDLATNFQRKFDNDHCNDVEKQSNFKKFDCLKADLSAFVETLSVSTFCNHYDRIYAMGNDTLIAELYDTLLGESNLSSLNEIKKSYTDLSERDPGEHWYDSIKLCESISKKGKKKQEARFDELATEHFCAYLSSPTQTVSNPKDKQKKACFYVEGLLENGGPSTDVFKKSLGEEKTAKLFREVLFGTC